MDSILQDVRECYITGDTNGLHKHHIYFGNPNRRISEENGFWVWLRWDWHNGNDYGVHFSRVLDLRLKQTCQEKYEERPQPGGIPAADRKKLFINRRA